jgi:hypothetical protein
MVGAQKSRMLIGMQISKERFMRFQMNKDYEKLN